MAQNGLVSAKTLPIDASLIRANVSMDALVARHIDAVEDANDAERDTRASGKFKKLCGTDPDASCHCCAIGPSDNGDGDIVEGLGSRPACKQHTTVDDLEGIVVDVAPQACLWHDEIVTGEEHDTGRFEARLDAIEATPGGTPGRITTDTIHGVGRVYAALEERRIGAVIPPLRSPRRPGAQGLATERFSFGPRHDVVRRKAMKRLTARNSTRPGTWYRAGRHGCARGPLTA